MKNRIILIGFISSIIIALVFLMVGAFNFFNHNKKYKSNYLGFTEITPNEYNNIVKFIFGDTLGVKKTYFDKNRNPITTFKSTNFQNVFVHKLSTSKNFNFDSIEVNESKSEIKTTDLYSFLIQDSGLPIQVKINSAYGNNDNMKIYVNIDGQVISKLSKSDSLLKIKLKFNSLSIGYYDKNLPDIYMAIDNGSDLKKFGVQTAEIIFYNSKFGLFMIFVNST